MQHNLTPQFVLDQAAKGVTSSSLDAACLFVDISGFTPLTVALMEHGPEGAEVLADVLVAVFEPLIDAVFEHGGFIAGFAGDAFKAVFPVWNEAQQHETVARALLAAWKIRTGLVERPTQATRFGDFTFSGKVCAACGPIEWEIWQGEAMAHHGDSHEQRAATVFKGAGLVDTMAIDPYASAGQLVIDRLLCEALPPGTLITTGVDGYARVEQFKTEHLLVAPPVAAPAQTTAAEPNADQAQPITAADFFPQWLLSSQIQGEFRQVVTLFVNVERGFEGAEQADFQSQLFRLVDQYGGFLARIGQIGGKDNGNTLLLFWGAPRTSEHDVVRALSFLLDLRKTAPVRLRAGLTTRMAFAGFVGSPLAEEYTCHGPYVNLAARQLVSADWDEIWIDGESARQAARHFRIERRGAYRFKGFADPQPVFLLQGVEAVEQQTFFIGGLVGRQREIDALVGSIQPIFSGAFAGVITVEGEAGQGKSRLVHEVELQTASMSNAPHWFRCQTDDILRQPLNPFRYWLRHYFSQAQDASDQANRAAFDATLSNLCVSTPDPDLAAELGRTDSFLAALVDLHWADSLYSQLDPQLRLENMLDALKTLIKAESLIQPVILLLEDVHWMDTESRQFIDQLTRNVDEYTFAILATQRPNAEPILPASEAVPQVLIELEGLSEEDVKALSAELLDGPPSPELRALIFARANGNPFFIEQIVLYLRDHGLLEPSKEGWQMGQIDEQEATVLPTDVRALLTARLDQLPPSVKLVVQTASVLGREFDKRVLAAMLDGLHELEEHMDRANRAKIWSAMGEARYLFRHALLRDAAYDMQLRSRLRHLHLAAAEAVRAVHAGEPASHYAELVHHYHLGEDWEEERIHAQLAGEYAAQQYANDDALRFYSRAIALASPQDVAGLSNVLLSRESVLDVLGAREEQSLDLQKLASISPSLSSERQISIQMRNAEYQRNTGEYLNARSTVADAVQRAQRDGHAELHIQALHLQGRILWQMGQYGEARRSLHEGIRLAEATDLPEYVARCNYDIGTAYQQEGNFSASRPYLLDAQRGLEQQEDLMGLARCTAMMGVLENEIGGFLSAQRNYTQALKICDSIGWRLGAAVCLRYLCNNFFDIGDFENAASTNQRVLSLTRELNDENGIANSLDTGGLIELIHGQPEPAWQSCSQALEIYQATGDKRSEAYAMTHLGLICIERDELKSAESFLKQAVELRNDLGESASQIDSMALLARVKQLQGDQAQALAVVETIIAYLNESGTDGIEFPFLVYAICGENLLRLAHDSPAHSQRAADLLKMGQRELERRAKSIDEADQQQRFIKHGPFHQEFLNLLV